MRWQVGGVSYPSDLSDQQWQRLERFFERPDPRGARSKYPKRRVVEAVLYRLREGCRWRALPHDFPPWDTVYDHWRRWQPRGIWPQAVAVLGTRWREVALGRNRRAPRHAILDSQAVKTAAEGEERGLDGGKKVKGRSRHVAVDSQGTLLAVHVCAANKADGAEAGTVMVQAAARHPSIESFTADTAYKRRAERVARELLGVELHITAKPKKQKPSRCRIQKGAASSPLRSAGASNAPSPGSASAGSSAKSTKRPSLRPKRGSGAP